jgi:hypothetical protein
VGLGTDRDVDAEFLRDIARRGGGEAYFTDDARQLPQLFSFDTMTRIRQSFQTESTSWKVTPLADVLASKRHWTDFDSGDYNLLFPRPEAETAIVSTDEDQAPGLAFWQRGSGRVGALAFDGNGAFAGQPFFDELVLDAVRWTMGSDVRDSFLLRARRVGNRAVASLEVSEEERQNFRSAELKIFAPDGSEQALPMRWVSHDKLEVDFPLDRTGAYRGMAEINGEQIRMDPVALPGSPEFLYDFPPGYGLQTLKALAREGGEGRELLDARRLFDRDAKTYARQPFIYPLILAALLLLLLDVAEQRFGMAATVRRRFGPALERLRDWRTHRAENKAVRRTVRESKLAGESAEGMKAISGRVAVKRAKAERLKAEKAAKALDKSSAPAATASTQKAPATPAASAPASSASAMKAAKKRAQERMGK